MDALIDPKKAILWQLHKLGPHYRQWVNTPSTRDSFLMWESPFLEALSKQPWYWVVLVWLPIITWQFLSALGRANNQLVDTRDSTPLGATEACALAAFGFAFWSLTEYVFHRFFFHGLPTEGSTLMVRLHFVLHGQHHKFPRDPLRLVMPPSVSLMISVPFHALFHALFPAHAAMALFAGFVAGYVSYDIMHYYLHHGAPVSPYLVELKRAHREHHYRDHSKGFGISSKAWDNLFGTLGQQPGSKPKAKAVVNAKPLSPPSSAITST